MTANKVRMTLFAMLSLFASSFIFAEDTALKENFERLMAADKSDYLRMATQFIAKEGVKPFLERKSKDDMDWRGAAVARACLARMTVQDTIDGFLQNPDILNPISSISDALITGQQEVFLKERIHVAEEAILSNSGKGKAIPDTILLILLDERLAKGYQTKAWKEFILKQFDNRQNAGSIGEMKIEDYRDSLVDAESAAWQIMAVRILSLAGRKQYVYPVAWTAIGNSAIWVRCEALSALARFKNRQARGEQTALEEGKKKTFASGGKRRALVQGTPHEWDNESVVLSESEQVLIWQTLLVCLSVDTSLTVRMAAARALKTYGNRDAVPFLKQMVAEASNKQLKAIISDAIDGLTQASATGQPVDGNR